MQDDNITERAMAVEKQETKKKKKKVRHRGLRVFLVIQLFLMGFVLAVLGWYYFGGYAKKVSDLRSHAIELVENSTKETFRKAQTSVAYDANGNVIATLKGEKDVYYLPIEEIPEYVKQAVISIEDKKFYSHHGFDIAAIIRAVLAMVRNGHVSGGASTITQQLARNIYLTTEKTWERKVEEIYIAVELEKKYTKQEILEFYLNNIYFANGNYGIEAASQGYFSKSVGKLTLSEIAYLVSIPNRPSYYDPLVHPENTLARRDRILRSMLSDNVISEKTYGEAMAQQIVLNVTPEQNNNYAKSFTLYCAIREIMKSEGFEFRNDFFSEDDRKNYESAYNEKYRECNARLYTGGYRIYTSLDLNIQKLMQDAIDNTLSMDQEKTEDGTYTFQGAAACIDNMSGFVKAIVGGRSQETKGMTLNRAYQSYRQPGSTIKPLLVYTPAIERGYTADTIVIDEKTEDGPKNWDDVYSGEMTLRKAVEQSKNTVAWDIFKKLTPEVGFSYITKLGFYGMDPSDRVQAAGIGGFTHGVNVLEMAKGYSCIEHDGSAREATCVIRITDADGKDLYVPDRSETKVYDVTAARKMTDILEGAMIDGTGGGYEIPGQVAAGKTGTTTGNRDKWFVGYTRYYTTAVWVGFDAPRDIEEVSEIIFPLHIWHDFMVPLHEGKRYLPFLDPMEVRGPETREFENLSADSSSADSTSGSSSSESSSVPGTMIISDETPGAENDVPETQPDIPEGEDDQAASGPPPDTGPEQSSGTGSQTSDTETQSSDEAPENRTSNETPGPETNNDNENL